MENLLSFTPIAYISNDFKTKFGIPRQSGITNLAESEIVFTSEFRDENALRGLEDYSHLWLIWYFSDNKQTFKKWSPTVRPPRLGGNKRMGVFATRSPNRPNPIGLSCVKIEEIKKTDKDGMVIVVSGADLMDGTPILDIKPYLTISDCFPDAKCGFADETAKLDCNVEFSEEIAGKLNDKQKKLLTEILQNNPRPSYHKDACRRYKMLYSTYEIGFKVCDNVVTVVSVEEKYI